jgi:hypothetical protein
MVTIKFDEHIATTFSPAAVFCTGYAQPRRAKSNRLLRIKDVEKHVIRVRKSWNSKAAAATNSNRSSAGMEWADDLGGGGCRFCGRAWN